MGGRAETEPDPISYSNRTRHFDVLPLPASLLRHLPRGPLALADFGCGDGPLFAGLECGGYISSVRPVYAVDMEPERLSRVTLRFPFIVAIASPADATTPIPEASLDFAIATMVLEHVRNEAALLDEMRRVLKNGGRAYITTVYKRKWAWYFRRRGAKTVLDVSHLREYTDMQTFRALLGESKRFSKLLELTVEPMWFPVVDPLLFLVSGMSVGAGSGQIMSLLRKVKVPIPGYYTLTAVLEV